MEYLLLVKCSRILANIIDRCYNPNHKQYNDYGGRGIYVEGIWLYDPTKFQTWWLENYFDDGQVDRIDNDGPYGPNNCKISTRTQNVRNRRNTVMLSAWGESKPFAEWIGDSRVNGNLIYTTVKRRIDLGWPAEQALTDPPGRWSGSNFRKTLTKNDRPIGHHIGDPEYNAFGETKTLAEWSKDERCVVAKNSLWWRLNKGWDIEKALTTRSRNNKEA